nr:hypothetical protein 8 [Paracoccaceae bacterium]
MPWGLYSRKGTREHEVIETPAHPKGKNNAQGVPALPVELAADWSTMNWIMLNGTKPKRHRDDLPRGGLSQISLVLRKSHHA